MLNGNGLHLPQDIAVVPIQLQNAVGVIAGELQMPPPGASPPTAEKLNAGSNVPLDKSIAKTFPTVIGASGRLADTPT
jgi:hypothetical protein